MRAHMFHFLKARGSQLFSERITGGVSPPLTSLWSATPSRISAARRRVSAQPPPLTPSLFASARARQPSAMQQAQAVGRSRDRLQHPEHALIRNGRDGVVLWLLMNAYRQRRAQQAQEHPRAAALAQIVRSLMILGQRDEQIERRAEQLGIALEAQQAVDYGGQPVATEVSTNGHGVVVRREPPRAASDNEAGRLGDAK